MIETNREIVRSKDTKSIDNIRNYLVIQLSERCDIIWLASVEESRNEMKWMIEYQNHNRPYSLLIYRMLLLHEYIVLMWKEHLIVNNNSCHLLSIDKLVVS